MGTVVRISEAMYRHYVDALVAGDRHACKRLTEEAKRAGTTIKEIYTDLFQPALYQIGHLWEYNRISVATEHMATSITEGLMNSLYADIAPSRTRTARKAVITSVEGELHQVGAKMVADVFEMEGWDALYLGANTPTGELIRFCTDVSPSAIALSLSVYFHMPNLEKMLTEIRARFPGLPVIIGGQAFRHGGSEVVRVFDGVVLLPSLDALERHLRGEA